MNEANVIDYQLEKLEAVLPKQPQEILSWLEDNIELSARSAYKKGRYDVEQTPYLKEPFKEFAKVGTKEIVLLWGAQLGKTTFMSLSMLWGISENPRPTLLALPTIKDVKGFIVRRIEPVIAASKKLKKIFKDFESVNKKDASTLSRVANGVDFIGIGMASSSQRQGHSVGVVLLDEVDQTKNSFNAINELRNRVVSFVNSKIIFAGTPSIKGYSSIEKLYEETDKRQCYVPCLNCGLYQVLAWTNFITPKNKKPYYRCKKKRCGFRHYEEDKKEMLSKCEWRASKKFEGKAGYHLSSLYSPFFSWEDLAQEKNRAEKDWQYKENFYRNYRAEAWDNSLEGNVIYHEGLMALREEYPENYDIPKECVVLFAGVDIQGNRVEVEFVGYDNNWGRWHIEYLVIPGDTAIMDEEDPKCVWVKLKEALFKEFKTANGDMVNVDSVFIDRGYARDNVMDFCTRWNDGANWFPVRGYEVLTDNNIVERRVDKYFGCEYFAINNYIMKKEVFRSLADGLNKGRTHFPVKDCYNKEYFRQISSEMLRRVKSPSTGRIRERWMPREGFNRNEALDINVYLEAGRHIYYDQIKNRKDVEEETNDDFKQWNGLDMV